MPAKRRRSKGNGANNDTNTKSEAAGADGVPAKRLRQKGNIANNDEESEAAGAVPEAVPQGQVECSAYLWPKMPRILRDEVLLPGAPSLQQWQRRHPPPRPHPTHTPGGNSGHTPRSVHGPPRESQGSLHGIPQGLQMRDPQGRPETLEARRIPRDPQGPLGVLGSHIEYAQVLHRHPGTPGTPQCIPPPPPPTSDHQGPSPGTRKNPQRPSHTIPHCGGGPGPSLGCNPRGLGGDPFGCPKDWRGSGEPPRGTDGAFPV